MLCEKCGKKNKPDAIKCSGCGAPMPGKSACGGFGDILSFEKTAVSSGTVSIPSGVDSAEVAKLSKHIKSLERNNKRLGIVCLASLLMGVVAIGVSVFVMTSSIKKEDVLHEINGAGHVSQDELGEIEEILKSKGIITEEVSLSVETIVDTAKKRATEFVSK